MMRKRITSLLLCFVMALSLLPTAVFAAGGTAQSGKATLIGFAAGRKAGNAYIQNNGMKIMTVPASVDGNNPNTTYGTVGQTAVLNPYTPSTVSKYNPGYEHNDYSATAIIVQNADEAGTGSQRRLRKVDTFQPGMTYRFTFQDTSWPVNSTVKGGGYLGELTEDDFNIRSGGYGASVVKVERIAQKVNVTGDSSRDMQGFFYNVWIKIDGSEKSYSVGTVGVTNATGLTGGYAKEGTEVKLTAPKMKDGKFFTDWSVTADNTSYTDALDISYYCNLKRFTRGDTSDNNNVYCSFLMGDKSIRVEAVYAEPGTPGVGDVTFSSVKLWVTPPVNGGKAVAAAVPEFDGLVGEAYQINKVEWLEDRPDGAYNYLHTAPSKTFDPSMCYTMRVLLKLNDGYAFTDQDSVNITINGKQYGSNTKNTLYNEESRDYPVSYRYNAADKTLAIYIPANGTNTRLEDYYREQAALTFTDGQDVARIESVQAVPVGTGETKTVSTASDQTTALAAGKYTVKVNILVSETMKKLMAGYTNKGGKLNGTPMGGRSNGNPVTLDAAVLGLVNPSDLTDQIPFDSGTKNPDGTYAYTSEPFTVDSGEKYLLMAALDLKAKPLIPQFELNYPDEMLMTDKNLTASATIEGTAAKGISGSITYTSAVRYNGPVQTGIVVKVGEENVPDNGYTYQWQRKNGSNWTDIEGATGKQYTPAAEDVGKEIRLVVTGTNGYTGLIAGGAKKVEKAVKSGYPERPQLNATKVDETYTGFEIVNYDSDCEYVWSLTETPNWNSNKIVSSEVNGLEEDTTYNVFVRYKATDTAEAGTGVSFNSVTLTDITYLSKLVLSDANGEEYAPFGAGNTIYVKAGEEKILTVAANPSGANTWEAFTFGPYNNASTAFSVTGNASVAASSTSGAAIPATITIKGGAEATSETLVAARGGAGSYYGSWKVVVYTDEKIPSFEITNAPTFDDVTLEKGETYTPDAITIDNITVRPEDALTGAELKWKVCTGTGYGKAYGESNASIAVDETTGKITAKEVTDSAQDWQKEVVLFAVKGSMEKSIANYHVTVNAKESIALTGIAVTPKTLKLKAGESFDLVAAKIPVNADDITDITWSSNDTTIATVDDSTGKVTAVGTGTTTITATCNGKTATCKVTVIDPDHPHNVTSWSKFSESQHIGLCDTCGAVQYADHTWTKSGTFSDESYDYAYYTCTDCGAAKTEATAKPSSGGSSSGGSVSSSYVITVKDAKNGDVTADRKSASAGTTVTITVKPDSGYVLDDLTVTDAKDQTVKLTDKGSGKYTFTMPSGKVTVEASFSKARVGNPFVDVKPGSYYEDAVIWAVGKGITGGTSATTFDPDAACSRAQAVTFLWRAAGSPAPKSTTMPFTDVPSGSYYYDAVLWAVENGVTNGTSATTFGPSASCNRAQIVTFLWRAQKSPAAAAANPFTDVAADAYYTNAVLWTVKEGVTAGTTATTFSPAADCTRAQIVTFIYRALAD